MTTRGRAGLVSTLTDVSVPGEWALLFAKRHKLVKRRCYRWLRAGAVFFLMFFPWCKPLAEAPELVMIDFGEKFDLGMVRTNDSKVSVRRSPAGSFLCVETGTREQWPGVTFSAPGGSWNLADYDAVVVRVSNLGTNYVTIYCRVDNPGADGSANCVTGQAMFGPGESGLIKTQLKRTNEDKLGGKLFGMRGYPVVWGGPGTVNASNVTQLVIFVSKPEASYRFELGPIRAVGRYVKPTAFASDAEPFFPFIDT
ncbi:MAG: hypothetical protein N3G20_07225, partial [Verrucomicrobiae bacterium]|nr:hypothetical protein [Verrucomicrobiae bacterium]